MAVVQSFCGSSKGPAGDRPECVLSSQEHVPTELANSNRAHALGGFLAGLLVVLAPRGARKELGRTRPPRPWAWPWRLVMWPLCPILTAGAAATSELRPFLPSALVAPAPHPSIAERAAVASSYQHEEQTRARPQFGLAVTWAGLRHVLGAAGS